jgi:putative FmdB family regulatory protein
MPTYDFACTKCGHCFEHRQSMDAEPRTDCPQCGKEARREFSMNVNFQFKGDGFYTTDYRSDAYKKDVAKDKETAKGSETSAKKTVPEKVVEKKTSTKFGGEKIKTSTPGKPQKK